MHEYGEKTNTNHTHSIMPQAWPVKAISRPSP